MATRTTPRTKSKPVKSRPSSTEVVKSLLRRCRDYDAQLDTQKGRKAAIGRNQNILAENYLRKVLDAFSDLDDDCRLNRVWSHEHNPDGKEPPKPRMLTISDLVLPDRMAIRPDGTETIVHGGRFTLSCEFHEPPNLGDSIIFMVNGIQFYAAKVRTVRPREDGWPDILELGPYNTATNGRKLTVNADVVRRDEHNPSGKEPPKEAA